MTDMREEQRDGWNEEGRKTVKETMRELDMGEPDVDNDEDDDDGNIIGESDTEDDDKVSATHSCKYKASCIRMFDRNNVKDHSLFKSAGNRKGRTRNVHNWMFDEDWGRRDPIMQEKKDSFQVCALRPNMGLQKYIVPLLRVYCR